MIKGYKFIVSEEEKKRILSFHEKSSKNQYLIFEEGEGRPFPNTVINPQDYSPEGFKKVFGSYDIIDYGNGQFSLGLQNGGSVYSYVKDDGTLDKIHSKFLDANSNALPGFPERNDNSWLDLKEYLDKNNLVPAPPKEVKTDVSNQAQVNTSTTTQTKVVPKATTKQEIYNQIKTLGFKTVNEFMDAYLKKFGSAQVSNNTGGTPASGTPAEKKPEEITKKDEVVQNTTSEPQSEVL